jgi:hypothetical protein
MFTPLGPATQYPQGRCFWGKGLTKERMKENKGKRAKVHEVFGMYSSGNCYYNHNGMHRGQVRNQSGAMVVDGEILRMVAVNT